MAKARITTNGREVVNIMKSGAMESLLAERAARVASAAKSAAPVDSGEYRDSIEVNMEQHPTRVVAHIGSSAAHAMIVEANEGVLARALDAGR